MEILDIARLVLYIVSAVCLTVITVYVVMLLNSSTKLVKNIDKACDTINSELEPAVKDLKETLSGVNSLVKAADDRVKAVNCALTSIVGATGILGGKLKDVFSGVIEGFKAGLNMFKK